MHLGCTDDDGMCNNGREAIDVCTEISANSPHRITVTTESELSLLKHMEKLILM